MVAASDLDSRPLRSSGSEASPSRPRLGGVALVIIAAFTLQAVGTLFFIWELWSEILGIRRTPIPYAWQEVIQILASIGMVIGLLAGAAVLRHSFSRIAHLNRQVDVASGNYETHLRSFFASWNLSPSEQAVAIYAMKGFSNAEIAGLRATTPATVKSQMTAVYRKTGFTNRQQLIAFLVEELLVGIDPVSKDGAAKT